jgi:hypothetical protein
MPSEKIGECRVCGTHGELSFEHVPPRKAFNDQAVLIATIERLRAGDHPDNYDKGARQQQKGSGANTLCPRCNSTTGSWYGRAYVNFARQGLEYLHAFRSASQLYLPFRIQPLRIAKQIICMFMSINGPNFESIQTELVRFVLNKHVRHLPSHTRLFAFYSAGDRSRSSGVSAMIQGFNTESQTGFVFSEVTFPPLGFVLTLNSSPPDDRLADVTYFADDFSYHEKRVLWLRLPVLPIYTFFPGDYRDRETVLKDGERNLAQMGNS